MNRTSVNGRVVHSPMFCCLLKGMRMFSNSAMIIQTAIAWTLQRIIALLSLIVPMPCHPTRKQQMKVVCLLVNRWFKWSCTFLFEEEINSEYVKNRSFIDLKAFVAILQIEASTAHIGNATFTSKTALALLRPIIALNLARRTVFDIRCRNVVQSQNRINDGFPVSEWPRGIGTSGNTIDEKCCCTNNT